VGVPAEEPEHEAAGGEVATLNHPSRPLGPAETMPADIFIYSKKPLREPRGGLEDDLDDFLEGAGEVTGGGSGTTGWNFDVEIFDESQIEEWVKRLTTFLKKWKVPKDTYLKIGDRRIDVFTP
jgi:hypothetical protein